ncbi:molybdopterin molybdotransferase MoeA [Galbitalea sp. SE-J8]|uniref:molybdopterin molybdotransferase MoeA n=1 Tax=Galbitalea sp. SE-J8 TaxID=3054952 RepID=UPI00259D11EB|nr:gephyrin-like molybdotransferase Glp [Galbitalea sp. SE-J8]MDM4762872.1 molybdopterin molybdotransferase MoeA [Galbitalea sp. SE-J8]
MPHHAHRPAPSVDEHADRIRSLVAFDGDEEVALAGLLDRVLAYDVASPVDLPLFRNSERDGFAVRAADLPGVLRIVGEIAARPVDELPHLAPGTAVRIMTGAPVPATADAVVQVEDVAVDGDTVTVPDTVPAGRWIRDRGSDLAAGGTILTAPRRLGSRHLAALAAAGVPAARVRRRPRVALISTGAELAEHPTRLGEIHDANLPALVAAVRQAGADPVLAERVSDDAGAFAAVLERAVAASDVVVTSGGISMGDHEVVRDVLGDRGWFGHIAMQPGGPQGVTVVDGVPVLSFPGNPVSTQLSFEVFLAPLLRARTGAPGPARVTGTLAEPATSPAGKRQFLRGRWLDDGRVALASGPQSHLVAGLAAADCLLVVREHVTELAAGDVVETWSL